MQDQVSRLVGLDGFRVVDVIEDGDQLDLEVELVARADSCPHCSGADLLVHERPVVRVRDLTSDALAAGRDGYARYDRMLEHFGERLLPGRELHPEGERLPEIVEKAMAGGIATIVAQRVDTGRERELSGLAAEAIQFVLTPCFGTEEARRLAAASG